MSETEAALASVAAAGVAVAGHHPVLKPVEDVGAEAGGTGGAGSSTPAPAAATAAASSPAFPADAPMATPLSTPATLAASLPVTSPEGVGGQGAQGGAEAGAKAQAFTSENITWAAMHLLNKEKQALQVSGGWRWWWWGVQGDLGSANTILAWMACPSYSLLLVRGRRQFAVFVRCTAKCCAYVWSWRTLPHSVQDCGTAACF